MIRGRLLMNHEINNVNHYCLFEEGEIVATSFLPTYSRAQPLPPLDFPHLRIGVQQIRPKANHMREAQILSAFLTAHAISHELLWMPVNTSAHYCVQHYDIFVGALHVGRIRY